MLLYSILGVVFFLLLLFLFAPATVGVDYLLENKIQVLRVRICFLGIPFSIKIPLKKSEQKQKKNQEKRTKSEKKSLTPKQFISFSKSLYHAYLEIEDECKALIRDIKKRFACKEVYFVIRYGTVNPARTGILNGAIWTAGTMVLKVLDAILCVENKTMQVYPDFNRAFMCIHIKGKFQFKAFHAVWIVLKIIKLVNLIKSKINIQESIDTN